jgi:hypothetical protein
LKLASAGTDENVSITYFGDASWDLKACKELGMNFVLAVKDFTTC